MICAVLAASVRLLRRCLGERDGAPLHDRMITDALNGAALLPFFALILTVFSTSIIKDIEHASKVTFGLASNSHFTLIVDLPDGNHGNTQGDAPLG